MRRTERWKYEVRRKERGERVERGMEGGKEERREMSQKENMIEFCLQCFKIYDCELNAQ